MNANAHGYMNGEDVYLCRGNLPATVISGAECETKNVRLSYRSLFITHTSTICICAFQFSASHNILIQADLVYIHFPIGKRIFLNSSLSENLFPIEILYFTFT